MPSDEGEAMASIATAGVVPHVFLTRFNIPANKVESRIYNESWLRERVQLFERYTVPSVRAQDDRDRHWLVYLGADSPTWLVERMSELAEERILHPIYLSGPIGRGELQDTIRALIGARRGMVTSANLDNDDAIATSFLTRVREADWHPRGGALSFANGLVLREDRLRLFRYPENPFVVVADDSATPNFMTCWSDSHNRLARHMDVAVINGDPAWLQVIHQRNVSNRIRGKLTDPRDYSVDFPGVLDDLETPRVGERLRDAVLGNPGRKLRDSVRGQAAKTARQVLGQRRLDNVKYRLLRGRRS